MSSSSTGTGASTSYGQLAKPTFGGSPGGQPNNIAPITSSASPGLNGLQNRSVDYVTRLMSGQLSGETQDAINNAAATQAVSGGMPGSNRMGGTLYGNRTLRDIGLTSEGQQAQGFSDFLQLLQPSMATGEAVLNRNQNQSQFNSELSLRQQQQAEQMRQADLANQLARDQFNFSKVKYYQPQGGADDRSGAMFGGKWYPNGTSLFTDKYGHTSIGMAPSF
jgi:hypothetical protein